MLWPRLRGGGVHGEHILRGEVPIEPESETGTKALAVDFRLNLTHVGFAAVAAQAVWGRALAFRTKAVTGLTTGSCSNDGF